MARLSALGLIVCAIGISGCGGGNPGYSSYPAYTASAPATYDKEVSSPTIKNDPYAPEIEVETEAGKKGNLNVGSQIYGLYAKIDRKTGAVRTYVQWSEVYSDSNWRFYSRASSSKAQAYTFNKVDRQVSSCRSGTCVYTEVYNIYIPPADMVAGAKDGLSFKIYGQRGDERLVAIPASTVGEFNQKVSEAVKARGAASR